MLEARHHPIVYPFFQYYTEYLMKRRFRSVRIVGTFTDRGLPVLLIANHIGWWDGFWAMYLKRKVFKRKFYFMMQEDQLLRYRFFNRTGAFSVNKGSKEIIRSLNYASGLLEQKDNMVLIYPQGKLRSLYCSEFSFQKGIERIAKGKEGKIQVILSANLIDYLAHPKPSVTMYIEEFHGEITHESLERAYNKFYANCLSRQIKTEE
ncbi:MAG: lysophospholipid acyltransferase family protein [Porphyromonas sp.]|nr:lysophospholipid acyltransferase family protein [Porphyromonas sp.]